MQNYVSLTGKTFYSVQDNQVGMSILFKIRTVRKLVKHKLIDRGVYAKDSHKNLIIVMYHGIDKHEHTIYNQRFFGKNTFERHLVSFKKHFNILNADALANGNYAADKPNLVLTFDDGYANNYNYALPLLDKYGVHAYFFVTGLNSVEKKVLWADAVDIVAHHGKKKSKVTVGGMDFVLRHDEFTSEDGSLTLPAYIRASEHSGYDEKALIMDQLLAIYDFTKDEQLNDYWQLMTDEQIKTAAQSENITIGSHGFYHNNLGSLSNEDAAAEVGRSKNYLEGVTQKEVASIGFPDGSYTERLNDTLLQQGITQQFVVDYRFGDAGKRDFTYDRTGLYPNMGNTHTMVYKILHQ